MVDALSGLVDLHDAGLVHRDIKPRNIMVDVGGSTVLVDYGFGR